MLTVAINGYIALWLSRHGVFDQYNVMFDADSNMRLSMISNGWPNEGMTHPLLHLLFSIPIRIIVNITDFFFHVADPVALRSQIGIFIVPVFNGIGTLLLFWTLGLIGLTLTSRLLVSTLGIVGFSSLIFGSLPEHFAISGTMLYLLYPLSLLLPNLNFPRSWSIWTGVGTALAGITITNIVPFAVFSWLAQVATGQSLLKAGVRTLFLSVAVISITLGIAKAANTIFDIPDQSYAVTRYLRSSMDEVLSIVHAIPNAMASTVVASSPVAVKNELGVKNGDRYLFQFSTTGPIRLHVIINSLLVFSIFLLGVIRMASLETRFRMLLWGSVLAILFSLGLVTAWGGNDPFLYSQCWRPFFMVIIAGTLLDKDKGIRTRWIIFTCLICYTTINNLLIIDEMRSVLLVSAVEGVR